MYKFEKWDNGRPMIGHVSFGDNVQQQYVYNWLDKYQSRHYYQESGNPTWKASCIGHYRQEIIAVGREDLYTFTLYDAGNSIVYRIVKDSTTTLGFPLELFLISSKNTPL